MASLVDRGILWLLGQAIVNSAVQSVAESINMGRDSGFATIANEIGAYQWSAILDHKTCPICRSLDTKNFDPNDPLLDLIRPAIHPWCRCILVAILKEELIMFPVPITRLTAAEVAELTKNKVG